MIFRIQLYKKQIKLNEINNSSRIFSINLFEFNYTEDKIRLSLPTITLLKRGGARIIHTFSIQLVHRRRIDISIPFIWINIG